MNFFKKLFGKKPRELTEDEYNKHYGLKETGLERILGKSLGMVGHAIVPFDIGGAVDM